MGKPESEENGSGSSADESEQGENENEEETLIFDAEFLAALAAAGNPDDFHPDTSQIHEAGNKAIYYRLRAVSPDVASLHRILQLGWDVSHFSAGKSTIRQLIEQAGFRLAPTIHSIILFTPTLRISTKEIAQTGLSSAIGGYLRGAKAETSGKVFIVNPPTFYFHVFEMLRKLHPFIKHNCIIVITAGEERFAIDKLEQMMARPDFEKQLQLKVLDNKLLL